MCRLAACLVFARPEADRYPAGGFNRRERDLSENKAGATVSVTIFRPPGFILICQRNPAAEAAGRVSFTLRAVSGLATAESLISGVDSFSHPPDQEQTLLLLSRATTSGSYPFSRSICPD